MKISFKDGRIISLIHEATPERLAKQPEERDADLYIDEEEQPDLCRAIAADPKAYHFDRGALSRDGLAVEIRQLTGTRAAEIPDLIDTAIAQIDAGSITSLAKAIPILKLLLRGMKLLLKRLA